jgi:hypothetical protein
VWTHRKTFELAAQLGLEDTYAAAHVIRLWSWALDNAPDGDLSNLSPRAVAYGAGWHGAAEAFIRALTEAGWLDDGRQIHDWDEYAGRLVERREANAERMRHARAARRSFQDGNIAPSGHDIGLGAPDVHRTESGTSGARPGATGPDRTLTGPDRTGPDPSPPTPSPHSGEGVPPTPRKRGAATNGRRGRAVDSEGPGAELSPVTAEDGAVWNLARAALTGEMTASNWEAYIAPLEPIGRAPDGGLHLRAPPGLAGQCQRFRQTIRRALLDVGDRSPASAAIRASEG